MLQTVNVLLQLLGAIIGLSFLLALWGITIYMIFWELRKTRITKLVTEKARRKADAEGKRKRNIRLLKEQEANTDEFFDKLKDIHDDFE